MIRRVNNTMLRGSKNLFLFLFFITALSLKAQITKDDLLKAINIDKLEHPYLFFSNEDKPKMLERIKNDPESKTIMTELLAEGNRFVKMPFTKKALIEPQNPRYETDGEAVSYVQQISRGSLTTAFLYQMTGDEQYAKRAIEFAIAICDLPVWVNGAHKFDVIYPRVWPRNVPDDQVVFSFDITAARIGRILATVYDWIYPSLNMHQRDKIRSAILENAITRVRGDYDFFWWSTAYRCNWSAVCYSGLGVMAMSLLKDTPQIIDVVAESYNRMNLIFNEIGEDGAWQEGRGYYTFMLDHSLYFMDALKRITNGKFNLFTHDRIKKNSFDFPLFALTASFADSEGGPVGSSYVLNKFIEETGDNTAAWYRENFIRDNSGYLDLIWPKSSVTPIEPKEKSKFFSSVNWAMLRSDFFDPSKVTIASKAGYNDDPHHGHLDVGHFILTWQNTTFIRDLGGMRYDEYYFNDDRFDYAFASSLGHNVIHVNGEQQIIAKKKNQPWKEGVGGKVLDFRTSDKHDYVLMDPTKAYPNKELKKWRRSIVLEKPVITLVLDEVEANPGSEISARFFPGVGIGSNINARNLTRMLTSGNLNLSRLSAGTGEYKIMENYVLLSSQRHSMALIPLVLNNSFKVVENQIPHITVTADARLTWIPFVETVTNAKSNTSIIATVILPVKDQNEAEKIAGSAKVNQLSSNEIEITVDAASGNYKWIFEKKADGYILNN